MNLTIKILYLLTIFLSLYLYKIINKEVIQLCEAETCPLCFGTNLCKEISENRVQLYKDSFFYLFSNFIGVKNVFYGSFNDNKVVLKKLAHSRELNQEIAEVQNYTMEIINILLKKQANFQACSRKTAELLLDSFRSKKPPDFTLENIWTLLNVNAEPLVLQELNHHGPDWPVPVYLGACGRLIVETYSGLDLNAYTTSDWFTRAKLAVELLRLAKNFTDKHPKFRFYLTDISPDNIAISEDLRVNVIDLENVIVSSKDEKNYKHLLHHTVNFDNEYAFSIEEICNGAISDHNYYAVCKLLLSQNAPWPMMSGGLLHSPPNIDEITLLFNTIHECIQPSYAETRFQLANTIVNLLSKMIIDFNNKTQV